MIIRRFEMGDAEEISALIRRNFFEVNIKDYPKEEMEVLANTFNADKVIERASYAHMYVICENDIIIGTGAISSFWGSETESILLTLFVLPEMQGYGVGKKIIETLENDVLFQRANRIEVPASITACEFYKRMGYTYKHNKKELNDQGVYIMEKFRN